MMIEFTTQFGVRLLDNHDGCWSVSDGDTVIFTRAEYEDAEHCAKECASSPCPHDEQITLAERYVREMAKTNFEPPFTPEAERLADELALSADIIKEHR